METLFKQKKFEQQFLFEIEKSHDVDSLKKIVALLSNQVYQQKIIIDNLIKNEQTNNITLSELGEKFLSYSKTNHTKNTFKRNRGMLKNLYNFFTKTIRINEITSEQIEQYKIIRKQSKTPQGNITTNATINRELALLKTMFNKAKAWSLIEKNPFDKVKLLKEDPRPINFCNKEDVNLILYSPMFKNKLYAHYEPMVWIGIYTGLRRGEIFNLKWKNIDMVNNIITVEKSKSHKVRHIPINDKLKNFLMEYKNKTGGSGNDYVVTYRGEKIKSLHRGWKNFLMKSGVKKYYRFHDLRHTFASYLVMNNVDITTVQKLLGHSDVQTTMRYSHISDKHTTAAVKKLNFQGV